MVEFPDTEVNEKENTASEAQDPGDLATKYGWPQANERGYRIQEQPYGTERPVRIIHVGAGISGICMAKFAPETLMNVSLVCYDKNPDIGGTWLENKSVFAVLAFGDKKWLIGVEDIQDVHATSHR